MTVAIYLSRHEPAAWEYSVAHGATQTHRWNCTTLAGSSGLLLAHRSCQSPDARTTSSKCLQRVLPVRRTNSGVGSLLKVRTSEEARFKNRLLVPRRSPLYLTNRLPHNSLPCHFSVSSSIWALSRLLVPLFSLFHPHHHFHTIFKAYARLLLIHAWTPLCDHVAAVTEQ